MSMTEPASESSPDGALKRVADALRGLRFGEVTLIVQDGVVVQIERTERLRIKREPQPR
jgi:hypothetical protein